jgi:hypothetical protein
VLAVAAPVTAPPAATLTARLPGAHAADGFFTLRLRAPAGWIVTPSPGYGAVVGPPAGGGVVIERVGARGPGVIAGAGPEEAFFRIHALDAAGRAAVALLRGSARLWWGPDAPGSVHPGRAALAALGSAAAAMDRRDALTVDYRDSRGSVTRDDEVRSLRYAAHYEHGRLTGVFRGGRAYVISADAAGHTCWESTPAYQGNFGVPFGYRVRNAVSALWEPRAALTRRPGGDLVVRFSGYRLEERRREQGMAVVDRRTGLVTELQLDAPVYPSDRATNRQVLRYRVRPFAIRPAPAPICRP